MKRGFLGKSFSSSADRPIIGFGVVPPTSSEGAPPIKRHSPRIVGTDMELSTPIIGEQ